ncbi:MAG: bifunctional metallophosphatase/5'-nucleotidase [Planctomycetota bacterium]
MNSLAASRRLAAAFGGLCLATLATAQTRVQILHASDLEGDVDAVVNAPNFAAVVDRLEAIAGTAGIPSLLLSAGDNYLPGPFFSAAGDGSLRGPLRTALANPFARELEGRVDVAIMNILGVDASAVGNHEFDAGTQAFRDLIGTDVRVVGGVLSDARWLGAQFPYLSANLDFSGDAPLSGLYTPNIRPSTDFESPLSNLPQAVLAPKLAPATIVNQGGQSFGVVGATTPLVASISSTGGVTVRNPGAGTNDMAALALILQPTIDQLQNLGIDKIVLVTHLQQIALEQQLVPLLRGVDIAIAGGSDTLLADATDRLRVGDVAAGNYPLIATNADGQPAVIVSTDGQYSYVGRLVIDFDAQGVVQPNTVVAAESGAFATDSQGVLDLWGDLSAPFAPGTKGGTVRDLTNAVQQVVIQKDGNIVGNASVFLEGRRAFVRTEETNLGTLTAEANLAAARSLDPTVQVSLKNGGGIRNPIGSIDGVTGALLPTRANPLSGKLAGQISQLDIEDSLRFNNGLAMLTLTRAQLKQVLEHAVAATGPGATPGQFGQIGGMSFSFDSARAVGDRVRFAALTDPLARSPVVVAEGQVIGADPIRVVTLDFLANGGDSYPYPSFINANPTFANRVDLRNAGLPAGGATFAAAGTEQDALAEFFLANHSTTPFATAETAVASDLFIQQLAVRGEGVLAFVDPAFQINVSQDLVHCGPITIDVVGALPGIRLFNLISAQCTNGAGPLFGIGGDALSQLFLPPGFQPFHVFADSNGIYQWTLPTSCSAAITVEAVSLEIAEPGGVPFLNRVSRVSDCSTIAF